MVRCKTPLRQNNLLLFHFHGKIWAVMHMVVYISVNGYFSLISACNGLFLVVSGLY